MELIAEKKPRKPIKRITYTKFCQIMEGFLSTSTMTVTGPVIDGLNDPFGRPRDARGRFLNSRNVERTPTVKQIWKYASECVENSIERYNRGRQPQKIEQSYFPSPEEYANAYNNLRRYNSAIDRRLYQIAERAGGAAIGHFDLWRHYFTTVVTRLGSRTHRPTRPPAGRLRFQEWDVATIFNDVLAICQNLPTVWDREKKTIKIITPPAIVVSPRNNSLRYNFGRFFILLQTNGHMPLVLAHTPRVDRLGHECVHPHVQRNGDMCYGNGERAARLAFQQGRFFDLVQITMAVLPQHGGRPFCEIRGWDGVCDERFDPATGLTIAIDAVIPSTVTLSCLACRNNSVSQLFNCNMSGCRNQNQCGGCLEKCAHEGCENHFCSDHYWVCSGCDRRFCKDATGRSPHFPRTNRAGNSNATYCSRCLPAFDTTSSLPEDEDDEEDAWSDSDDDYENEDDN